MIALNNARLDLFDVDVQATVPDATNSDHWSLFSFGGPDRLTCRNVNITVTNPGNRQAEVVDISSNTPMPSRQPNPMGAPPEFEIELERCLIRGSCVCLPFAQLRGAASSVGSRPWLCREPSSRIWAMRTLPPKCGGLRCGWSTSHASSAAA